jgi:hypothetical protein
VVRKEIPQGGTADEVMAKKETKSTKERAVEAAFQRLKAKSGGCGGNCSGCAKKKSCGCGG